MSCVILLIGCEVIIRELCDAVAHSPHLVDTGFLPKGLHDLGGGPCGAAAGGGRRGRAEAEQYDAIVLGYGLCGNGLAGLRPRSIPLVMPRAHDCIALLMGSRSRLRTYFARTPGVYFRSSGWIERGARPGAAGAGRRPAWATRSTP